MEKKCLTCENRVEPHKKRMLKSWLSDFGGGVFSWVSHRPNSKAHSVETSQRESLWKQTSTYLIFASGAGIACLGLGIYWSLSKKNKAKSK